jgi:hypothetical protein
MALIPTDDKHRLQILAGTLGRVRGHTFEKYLTEKINEIEWRKTPLHTINTGHLHIGAPAKNLMDYILRSKGVKQDEIKAVRAWWLGGLATLGEGDEVLEEGIVVDKSKSDILVRVETKSSQITIGVSVKSCSKKSPTNDQLYFTTAIAFCNLLRQNHIEVSQDFQDGLRMFCGDAGYRPIDRKSTEELASRKSDPSRYFYEELPSSNRLAIANTLTHFQEQITRILLQKAYPNDPYEPEFIIPQTKKYDSIEEVDSAIFTVDELIGYSQKISSFTTKDYVIRKGTYKHDDSVHQAPRFGYIQFQRGGQKQHPTQLQFNLQAGYFRRLP